MHGGEDDKTEITSDPLPFFSCKMAWAQLLKEVVRVLIWTHESHRDNYYYHLLMLYLPWHQKTKDLPGEYSTAQKSLLAKKD